MATAKGIGDRCTHNVHPIWNSSIHEYQRFCIVCDASPYQPTDSEMLEWVERNIDAIMRNELSPKPWSVQGGVSHLDFRQAIADAMKREKEQGT